MCGVTYISKRVDRPLYIIHAMVFRLTVEQAYGRLHLASVLAKVAGISTVTFVHVELHPSAKASTFACWICLGTIFK
jgi:hypothetical protein